VLSTRNRLRRSADFGAAVRRGRRCARAALVAHLLATDADGPPRVGFVVARTVGPAVTRNQVKRRLRHLMRARLDRLRPGTLLVVRALPPAADAGSARLAADLDAALDRLCTPAAR
jgi:ribonuclease P protein component